jgi:ABC-type tungstate transport system substrate-binding protein
MFDSIPSDVTIDRERFVDSTVNLIPIGIMAFFLVLFLLFNPFSPSWFFTVLMVGLHLVPIVLLGLLTYVSLR